MYTEVLWRLVEWSVEMLVVQQLDKGACASYHGSFLPRMPLTSTCLMLHYQSDRGATQHSELHLILGYGASLLKEDPSLGCPMKEAGCPPFHS